MKKISLYVFTALFLFSCQKEKKKQAEDTLTTTAISTGIYVITTTN